MTQDELKSILHYDPETGVFTWRIDISYRVKAGDRAGYLHALGYSRISIRKKQYQAHRLAFLYMDGYMPEVVDHINMVRDDNRWCNLRASNYKQNGYNSRTPKNNTSGVKGVSWCRAERKWKAQIRVDGKPVFLGSFDSLDKATFFVREARLTLHGEFHNHG